MWIQLRFLSGIIFIICLESALGNNNEACNCSCFLQQKVNDVCEFIREVKTKTDNMVISREDVKSTAKSELHSIIDERIKAYMDANNDFGKAQKEKYEQRFFNLSALESLDDLSDYSEGNDLQNEIKMIMNELELKYEELEHKNTILRPVIHHIQNKIMALENTRIKIESRIEEILEFLCSFINDIKMIIGFDTPSIFQTKFWTSNLCSRLFGFQKLSTPFINYKELEDLNATCRNLDSCQNNRNSASLIKYNCQCGPHCSTFDTCCFDSPFLGLPRDVPSHSCQVVYGTFGEAYFIVDQCPKNGTAGDAWKALCSQGEEHNLMTYVPVTSKITNVTYKNYYCFACHENSENYYFWEVKVYSLNKIATFYNGSPNIMFNSIKNEWTGLGIDSLTNESITIRIKQSSEIKDSNAECRDGVISKCHDDWLDDISRNKCISYTAIITFRDDDNIYTFYKNPHCAVCNFKSWNDTICKYIKPSTFSDPSRSFGYDFDYEEILKSRFSHTNIFALSSRRCPDNSVWNPFTNGCSPLKCSKGFLLKNKVCVPS